MLKPQSILNQSDHTHLPNTGVMQRSWKYHVNRQCEHFHIKASAKINFPVISQYGRFLTSTLWV